MLKGLIRHCWVWVWAVCSNSWRWRPGSRHTPGRIWSHGARFRCSLKCGVFLQACGLHRIQKHMAFSLQVISPPPFFLYRQERTCYRYNGKPSFKRESLCVRDRKEERSFKRPSKSDILKEPIEEQKKGSRLICICYVQMDSMLFPCNSYLCWTCESHITFQP